MLSTGTRPSGRRPSLGLGRGDWGALALSLVVALLLARSGAIEGLLESRTSLIAASFLAGFFFTSLFTTTPAIVALGEIAIKSSPWTTALFGALGSAFGDALIFLFARKRLARRLRGRARRAGRLADKRGYRWLTYVLGALVLASPLPDELGIGLLGLSRMRTGHFLLIAYLFNFVGILLIGMAARAM